MNKTIIGLAGPKRSGKTAAALKLERSGFVRYSFAGTLKRMIRVLLEDFGFSENEIDNCMNADKEVALPVIGKSPRTLMQTLGTEWGRVHVHPDLWTYLMMKQIDRSQDEYIVFDDVRFENEAEMIRNFGGLIIHIDRGNIKTDLHASEKGIAWDDRDQFILNDVTLDDFLLDVSIMAAGHINA